MTAVAAIFGLISELLGIAAKWGTATAEQRLELESEAERAFARCKASVFQLGVDLSQNNADARAEIDKQYPPEQR